MNNNISDEERRLFKENFDAFDTTGDGRLSVKELATALRSVGFHMTEKDAEGLHSRLIEMDQDISTLMNFLD